MPLLDIQRRGQQIGRIRLGQQVKAANGKMRPEKLTTFRFTTASRTSAEAIATLYGGEVRDWQNGQFEVITAKSEIGVTVPPRDEVVSQWYEMWNKGGCLRRCSSQHEEISGKPCLCPDDPQERARLAALNPPQACKAVTRISVMIPDLPGLGVWRLDTGSYYAATEIGDSAALMQTARDKGIFLPAILRIEQRQRVAGGQTKKFPVPVLEVLATFRQIASGELEAGGMTAQLPPAPGEAPRAITAAPPAPEPTGRDAPPPAGPERPQVDEDEAYKRAQEIADAARGETRAAITALADKAKAEGVDAQHVCTDRENDVWEELLPFLQDLWREAVAA